MFQRPPASPLSLMGAAPSRSLELRRQCLSGASWAGPGPPWPPSSPSPVNRGERGRLAQHTPPRELPRLAGLPSRSPWGHLRASVSGALTPGVPFPGVSVVPPGPGGLCVPPVDTASPPPLPAPLPSGVKLVHIHMTSHWLKARVLASPPPPAVRRAFPDLCPSIREGVLFCPHRSFARRSLPSPPRHPDCPVPCRPEAACLLPWAPSTSHVVETHGLRDSLCFTFFISKMGR